MSMRLSSLVRNYWSARRGSVAIQIALLMVLVVGMTALGTEITFVLYKHRQMQAAADSAALGAATALMTGHPADPVLEARATTASLGFTNGVDGVVVAVNRPPLTGVNTGNANAVEVVVSQPQSLTLVSLFQTLLGEAGDGLFSVGAHAVAIFGASGNYCVLQLNNSNFTGVNISNGANVDLTQCGMAVNATGSGALSMRGGSKLTATAVSVSGDASITNGAKVDVSDGIKTYQPNVSDPYADVAMPAYSGCDYTNKSIGWSASTQYLSPGVYCNGLSMGNAAKIVMNPGVYIIDRGTFSVGGGVTVTGTGVTIVLTKSSGSDYADVEIGNGVTVTLTAPTTGATAGLVFFGDRNAPLSNTTEFGGGARLSVTGAIYFPTQTVTYGNGISSDADCTHLIAGKINFEGGAKFNNGCSGTAVVPIGATASALVE